MIYKVIPDFDIAKIADSGQCFRMNPLPDGGFSVIAFGRYLEVRNLGGGQNSFSCTEEEFDTIWADYFDLDSDYSGIASMIPPDDRFLRAALAYGHGMRLLHQDPWEVMVSFILSQRKNIPAIKASVEALCSRYGEQGIWNHVTYHCFPTAKSLAGIGCEDLRTCSLGYRDKYVAETAGKFEAGQIRFNDLKSAGFDAAKASLKGLYGIGDKVADCILLFGLGYKNAFPEDTWIKKILEKEYAGHFPKERYDGHLGMVQQYMFYYARSAGYGAIAPLNSCD